MGDDFSKLVSDYQVLGNAAAEQRATARRARAELEKRLVPRESKIAAGVAVGILACVSTIALVRSHLDAPRPMTTVPAIQTKAPKAPAKPVALPAEDELEKNETPGAQ